MDLRRKLLWIDGFAGLTAGIVVLSLAGPLSQWYRLPNDLMLLTGVVNVAYGCYSLPLARRARRPMALILLLVFGNLFWAMLCFRWAYLFWPDASLFGRIHLVGEGLFVAGLALVEWRMRQSLLGAGA